MGLLQKACETYDAMAYRAGTVYAEEKEPLAPVSHILTRAQIEITLDQNGTFVSARSVDKSEPKIIIPVTEESAGRTSAPCAHPLCDQLGYVSPQDAKKHALYEKALADWADSAQSHPKLRPILNYVRSGSILTDLAEAEIIQRTPEGSSKDEKQMIRWVVNGLGGADSGRCWEDRSLMQSYIDYSAAKRSCATPILCMVSGKMDAPANQHPKGIVPINGNAKLISANDSSGFTYRGRFSEDWQAASVGFDASQKSHSALRWLIANQGVPFGGRMFLCWNPQGIPIPKVTGPMGRKNGGGQRAATPSQYRKQLQEALSGWKEDLPAQANVVIAAFDAATTGRLAVTYYNELMASDFLDRLHAWESSCCWENGPYGIQSPSLYQLVSWAFGTPRNGKVEIDDRILAQQMQRLTVCRVDKAPFPLDMERALVEKASQLLLYEGENRLKLLFTACAAIRKYHYDHLKEERDMALDKDCCDRSYLFGRLLAVADALESSTYTDEEKRETNAMRMQKIFTLRPMATWRTLSEKLRPYSKRLAQSKPRLYRYYQNLIDEILNRFSPSDSMLNQPLDDVYLLGFSHQRAYRSEKSAEQAVEQPTEE